MNALKKLQRNWEGLAQIDPMWAICTDPGKRNSQWTREEFFATGRKEIETVLGYVARVGLCLDKTLPALDFGCGVGRLTRALAEHFSECSGVDISPAMINMARELNREYSRCHFLLNDGVRLNGLRDNYYGFIYTSLVLQHIAHPYSHQYIAELVRVLKSGGMMIFQVPERLRASSLTKVRTRLALRARLRSMLGGQKAYTMEMHCIKGAVIRELMAQNGARVVDMAITNSCDPAFSGNLQYLTQEPLHGYVSKQYCVIKH